MKFFVRGSFNRLQLMFATATSKSGLPLWIRPWFLGQNFKNFLRFSMQFNLWQKIYLIVNEILFRYTFFINHIELFNGLKIIWILTVFLNLNIRIFSCISRLFEFAFCIISCISWCKNHEFILLYSNFWTDMFETFYFQCLLSSENYWFYVKINLQIFLKIHSMIP